MEKARLVKTGEIKTEKKHPATEENHHQRDISNPDELVLVSFGQSEQGRHQRVP